MLLRNSKSSTLHIWFSSRFFSLQVKLRFEMILDWLFSSTSFRMITVFGPAKRKRSRVRLILTPLALECNDLDLKLPYIDSHFNVSKFYQLFFLKRGNHGKIVYMCSCTYAADVVD